MSDRPRPARQVTKVASGTSYHTSSTRHTITRLRPVAMSPGGVGVDIKHNSYDRYLNRLKGKTVLRRGIVLPTFGADLSGIDFDNIKYFVRYTERQATTWEELPEEIKNTYERLGIPEAERSRLVACVAAQYESEVVYHQIREDLE